MRKIFYLIVLLSATLLTSCKKDPKPNTDTDPIEPTKVGSKLDLIRDSVYLYANEAYYWHDAMPDYATFKPRSFDGATDLAALQSEVDAISQFKINPATGKPYEYYAADPGTSKYSFIDNGEVSDELGGVKGDFGFAPFYNTDSDLRIKYVYPGSPAAGKGIKRGYQIMDINGRNGSGLTYDGDGTGTNLNFLINAYSNSETIKMTLKRPDATTFTVTLNTTSYTVNPVLAQKVITVGSRKVGYIVFNTFTSDANAKPKLDAAFSNFAAKGVTDLVVDLRYNGGGYVSTAEYLSNLIAPASKSGSLMYTTYYTDNLQNNKHPLLSAIYNIGADDFKPENNQVLFTKAGTLNATRVFFIVTGSTASASELTINNLLPVMNVKLIGTTSYGKPVGFLD
jgi:carboxyl-terminal processing protease